MKKYKYYRCNYCTKDFELTYGGLCPYCGSDDLIVKYRHHKPNKEQLGLFTDKKNN